MVVAHPVGHTLQWMHIPLCEILSIPAQYSVLNRLRKGLTVLCRIGSVGKCLVRFCHGRVRQAFRLGYPAETEQHMQLAVSPQADSSCPSHLHTYSSGPATAVPQQPPCHWQQPHRPCCLQSHPGQHDQTAMPQLAVQLLLLC